VLDETSDFESKCNMAMVALEPVEAEEEVMAKIMGQAGDLESHGLVDVMADMTKGDAMRLYQLVARHAHYTNSAKAKLILSDWHAYLPKFKKVMPIEYRRALQEIAKAQATEAPGRGELSIGLKAAKA
jgi:glutamate synthase (NADPH/NADH) large chain